MSAMRVGSLGMMVAVCDWSRASVEILGLIKFDKVMNSLESQLSLRGPTLAQCRSSADSADTKWSPTNGLDDKGRKRSQFRLV